MIISYSPDCIDYIQRNTALLTGWVIKTYNQTDHDTARKLAPDYLICNHQKFKNQALWDGSWQWVSYEVTHTETAQQLIKQGVALLETMDFIELSQILKDLNHERP